MGNPLRLAFGLLTLSILLAHGADRHLRAPNHEAKPVDQLTVSGNACGPAALLSAFRLAGPKWQIIEKSLPGSNDRQRLTYLIKHHGKRPSNHLKQSRWNARSGVNLLDLTDIGNELRGTRHLPKLRSQTLLRRDHESAPRLMKRCHGQLSSSLRHGLPPVVGLQRLTVRLIAGKPTWVTVHGHFIVITGIPKHLARGATSMPIQYADPWGGKKRTGVLKFDKTRGFPALVVDLPFSRFGTDKLTKGEHSFVILSSCLGAF